MSAPRFLCLTAAYKTQKCRGKAPAFLVWIHGVDQCFFFRTSTTATIAAASTATRTKGRIRLLPAEELAVSVLLSAEGSLRLGQLHARRIDR